MWAILKFKKNNLEFLKANLKEKIGNDLKFYLPKISIQKFKKNKLTNKVYYPLGDHIFLFHKNIFLKNTYEKIKFTKGLKYFFYESKNSQSDIKNFVNNCKNLENDLGYIRNSYLNLEKNKKYKFDNGPFTEKIFKIIGVKKNNIDITLGNFKTTLNYNDFNFSPVL